GRISAVPTEISRLSEKWKNDAAGGIAARGHADGGAGQINLRWTGGPTAALAEAWDRGGADLEGITRAAQPVDAPTRLKSEVRLEMSEEVRAHLDLCLVCRACETACPSGVPFGALMESTRGQVERRLPRTGARAWIEDRVFRDLLPSRRRLEWLALGLRFYQR